MALRQQPVALILPNEAWTGSPLVQDGTWCYEWDRENRMTKVTEWTGTEASETKQFEIEYRYCPSCSGALSARIKKDSDGDIESWLRYEYSGLELLRIDEVYDAPGAGGQQ